MKIQNNITIKELERWLPFNDFELEIRKSDSYEPVLLVALIQFFLTKSKQVNQTIIIRTNLKRADLAEIIDKFYDYYHLVIVVLYSNNVTFLFQDGTEIKKEYWENGFKRGLITQNFIYSQDFDDEILAVPEIKKKDFLEFRKRFFSKKSPSKINRGINFLIGAYDHLASDSLDKNYYLYSISDTKESTDIEPWLSRLFEFQGVGIKKEFLLNKFISELSIVIRELFQNTDEWAKTNYNDTEIITPNFRGVLINVFIDEYFKEKEISEYEPIVNGYLKRILNSNPSELSTPEKQAQLFNNNNKWGVCEISVLDTGPGMARRWLGKDYSEFSYEEEINAVNKCFNKYLTSDTSGRRHVRGRGLSRVISIIGKSGFLRVRTGRASLYRDFFQRQLINNEMEQSGLNLDKVEYVDSIEGTSISILYPFVYSEK